MLGERITDGTHLTRCHSSRHILRTGVRCERWLNYTHAGDADAGGTKSEKVKLPKERLRAWGTEAEKIAGVEAAPFRQHDATTIPPSGTAGPHRRSST